MEFFKNLKFGLDLQGGFEVLYQVNSIDGSEVTSDMMNSTYKALLKRIDILGVNEPVSKSTLMSVFSSNFEILSKCC